VGKDNPGRKLEPLDLANTPKDARYARKWVYIYIYTPPVDVFPRR
jgi:hypothetical protein